MNGFVVIAIISWIVLVMAFYYPYHHREEAANRTLWNATVAMLMVKDESPIIERIVRSLHNHVAKRIFLCDTGSTDDTLERALAIAAERSGGADLVHWVLPGGFKHFEQARNACRRALAAQAASDIEWVALPDADFEAVAGAEEWPAYDVNTIQIRPTHPGQPHNSLHLLVRARTYFDHCRYRLWTHEFLDCSTSNDDDNDLPSYGYYNGFHFLDHADGSSRGEKLERDIKLLRAWLAQVNETELRPRALYYLARAYEDNGQIGLALNTYHRHNAVQNHTNYQWLAHYRMALIELGKWNVRCEANVSECGGDSLKLVENAMLAAFRTYDGYFRREPLYQLAKLHRQLGHYHECLLYAGSALHLPVIDHSRIPLMIEAPMNGPLLLEEEHAFCVEQLKPVL